MSERSGGGSGVGPFLLGAAIGAALGYLFAPAPGTGTRRKLSRRWQDLKEFASEVVAELPASLTGEEGEAGDEDAAEQPEHSDREELERRLTAARRRRRDRAEGGAAAGQLAPGEDEPVA